MSPALVRVVASTGCSAGLAGAVPTRAPTGFQARILTPCVPNAAALDASGASEKVS
jgi:hypothetical protein